MQDYDEPRAPRTWWDRHWNWVDPRAPRTWWDRHWKTAMAGVYSAILVFACWTLSVLRDDFKTVSADMNTPSYERQGKGWEKTDPSREWYHYFNAEDEEWAIIWLEDEGTWKIGVLACHDHKWEQGWSFRTLAAAERTVERECATDKDFNGDN